MPLLKVWSAAQTSDELGERVKQCLYSSCGQPGRPRLEGRDKEYCFRHQVDALSLPKPQSARQTILRLLSQNTRKSPLLHKSQSYKSTSLRCSKSLIPPCSPIIWLAAPEFAKGYITSWWCWSQISLLVPPHSGISIGWDNASLRGTSCTHILPRSRKADDVIE